MIDFLKSSFDSSISGVPPLGAELTFFVIVNGKAFPFGSIGGNSDTFISDQFPDTRKMIEKMKGTQSFAVVLIEESNFWQI